MSAERDDDIAISSFCQANYCHSWNSLSIRRRSPLSVSLWKSLEVDLLRVMEMESHQVDWFVMCSNTQCVLREKTLFDVDSFELRGGRWSSNEFWIEIWWHTFLSSFVAVLLLTEWSRQTARLRMHPVNQYEKETRFPFVKQKQWFSVSTSKWKSIWREE